LFAKNQKEIDAVHLAELKNKIEDLKQTLAAIEGEFKQKGKLTVDHQKYYMRKGEFFNAFKYSKKLIMLFVVRLSVYYIFWKN
jgi:ABC-type lipoprotein release transport system permease subunit